MEHELKGIRYQSEKYAKLTTLINRVNEESLKEAHRHQKTGKAVGIDSVTKEEYESKIYPIKWTQQEEGFLENGHKQKG